MGCRPGVSALPLVPFTTMIAGAVEFAVLMRGARVFVGLWMLQLRVSRRSAERLAARPAQATPDRPWNDTTGIEIGITSLLSWWASLGALIRMAPYGRRRRGDRPPRRMRRAPGGHGTPVSS